jgi:hypothetical protein
VIKLKDLLYEAVDPQAVLIAAAVYASIVGVHIANAREWRRLASGIPKKDPILMRAAKQLAKKPVVRKALQMAIKTGQTSPLIQLISKYISPVASAIMHY